MHPFDPVQAPRCNAPLIQFLILALYILFACLYSMLLRLTFFLQFFLTYLLPYLSFPLRIDPLCFQASEKNVSYVFCVHFVL